MITRFKTFYSELARNNRNKVFLDYLNPNEKDRILDIGSGDGSYIASIIPFRKNVFIADISQEMLDAGKAKFGFNAILLDENGSIPCPDKYFDIVFASSVIEHVTGNKKDNPLLKSKARFTKAAEENQRRFAEEIKRVSKRYFVQTPNRYFFIESHTWLPFFIVLLPRQAQIDAINFFNKWWPKKAFPDWNLLTKSKMQEFFPEADIVLEKSFGFTKSIMAIKR